MNYRHIYHAGNHADVFKHAVLCILMRALQKKDAPFQVLDTHGGLGRYALYDEKAQKTQESLHGIAKLWPAPANAPAGVDDLLKIVKSMNADSLAHYPGSPWVAHTLLRAQDHLIVCELHPDDATELKHNLRGKPNVAVHHTDGYQALKAFLPPVQKRGLILIDPPFEKPDEFKTLVDKLAFAHSRFSSGVYAVWYPIKDRPAVSAFHEQMSFSGLRKIWVSELTIRDDRTPDKFNGSGMMVINPPFGSTDVIDNAGNWLLSKLKQEDGAAYQSRWLVGE